MPSTAASPHGALLPGNDALPTIKEAEVLEVTASLPLSCPDPGLPSATTALPAAPQQQRPAQSVLEALGAAAGAEWFRRTGARKPQRPRPALAICLVDESAMGRRHWDKVNSLLPPCHVL